MRYTQVRADTFENIQINAGVVLSAFDVSTGSYNKTDIIGATTGGNTFTTNPSFVDYFDDVDNMPKNTKQGKHIDSFDPTLTTTFVAADTALGNKLCAAADIDGDNSSHIIPRNYLKDTDFSDLWLVGDYSDNTGNTKGGFIAIHLKNALNTSGFQIKTTKAQKGTFSAEFHGHYDLEDIDDVPYELYIKKGTAETIVIKSQPESQSVTAGTAVTFSVTAVHEQGETMTYKWQKKGTSDADFADITGATSATLTLAGTDVTTTISGTKYRCAITSGTETINTSEATLTVTSA